MHTLIIEDDLATSALLHRLVRRIWPKSSITLAADPVLALDHLQEIRVDLVLIDWELPGMSGLEVLLTSHSDPEIMRQAHELQVDAYILKPIDAPSLMDALSQLVN